MRQMREQWKEMKRNATTDEDRKRLKEVLYYIIFNFYLFYSHYYFEIVERRIEG